MASALNWKYQSLRRARRAAARAAVARVADSRSDETRDEMRMMARYRSARPTGAAFRAYTPALMHFDAHQPVIDDLEARILAIRDSL